MFISLVSFDANDPSFNLVRSGDVQVQNKAGLLGSYAAGFLNDFFGVASFLLPGVFVSLGLAYLLPAFTMRWWRWSGFFLLTVCFMVFASSVDLAAGQVVGGGMVGGALRAKSAYYLSPAGSFLFWLFVFVIGVQLTFNFSWLNFGRGCAAKIGPWLEKARLKIDPSRVAPAGVVEKLTSLRAALPKIGLAARLAALKEEIGRRARPLLDRLRKRAPIPGETTARPEPSDAEFEAPADFTLEEPEGSGEIEESVVVIPAGQPSRKTETPPLAPRPARPAPPSAEPETKSPEDRELLPVPLPPADLLTPAANKKTVDRALLEEKGRALMACFNDFDVKGDLVAITPGPVVTMYEVRPAPGVRVSKISNLADDLCLALKAVSARIQAPLPGTDRVGIELPNDAREIVNFRELVESDDFVKGCGPLTMILGRDIAGKPYMADLASMPHLLVAGSTGAGKSVCLNSIILSFIYRLRPEQMQLMLIDPKRIEMSVYADLPHLVHPVVTEMSDARNALDWAVHEMMRRYDIMKPLGARNIVAYNQKLAAMGDNPLPEYAGESPLPYLVIIIDELADLMMTAPREVEGSIVRLGQLARAAGIHMILATQRPSVDVVTSLIKTNMSGRISFKVTSKYDSRTILDQNGAERLLGYGDMLFKPPTTTMTRLHGPFVSDDEVAKSVNYWKERRAPGYKVDFSQWSSKKDAQGGGGDAKADLLYEEAKAFVIDQGYASISRLQRQFSIGYNRAARLVEQLERDGLLAPSDSGSKPRKVINN